MLLYFKNTARNVDQELPTVVAAYARRKELSAILY
jgi:hypothetical protein